MSKWLKDIQQKVMGQGALSKIGDFLVRNLQKMRQFATYYPDLEIVPQAVAQLPLGHFPPLANYSFVHIYQNDLFLLMF